MTCSVLLASLNSIILRKFKNRTFQTPGDSFFFHGGLSAVWTAIMLVWFFAAGEACISLTAIGFGTVYGMILCLFLYFKNQSIATGPVSLTSLIGNCAFIIATWFGVVYVPEKISVFQLVGMALIVLSLFLCINPQKSGKKLCKAWFLYCIAFFFAGGLIGIFYKVFGKSNAAGEVNGMMLTASVVSCILFFAAGMLRNKAAKLPMPSIKKEALFYVLLSGLTGCVYIRLNVSLSALIPSAIFFPVSNGGIVILTTAAGTCLFKEKLNKLQLLGILVGLIAIAVTGCGEYLWTRTFQS